MKERALRKLVERAKHGDQEALSALLQRFRPLIRACCRGLSMADGQDLEQDLSIQLVRLVQRYELNNSESFESYVKSTGSDPERMP